MTTLEKFKLLAGNKQITDEGNDLWFPLSRGSFGDVYLQYNKLKNEIYIRKHSMIPKNPVDLRKSLREISYLYTFHRYCDPYIICPYKIYTVEPVGNQYKIDWLMKYVGPSLNAYLKYNKEKLQVNDYLIIMTRLLEGLHFIHRKKFIHKDIKPGNIVFDYINIQPKYIDFGGACMDPSVIDDRYSLPPPDLRLTEKEMIGCFNEIMGTPVFMSPEIFRKSSVQSALREDFASLSRKQGITIKDKRRLEKLQIESQISFDLWAKTDLWALGVTFWNMITNTYPFDLTDTTNFMDIIVKITTVPCDLNDYKTDSPIIKEVIDLTGGLVNSMLEKNPINRPKVGRLIEHMHMLLYKRLVGGGSFKKSNYDMALHKYVEQEGPRLVPNVKTPADIKGAKTLNNKNIKKLVKNVEWKRAIYGLSSTPF